MHNLDDDFILNKFTIGQLLWTKSICQARLLEHGYGMLHFSTEQYRLPSWEDVDYRILYESSKHKQ